MRKPVKTFLTKTTAVCVLLALATATASADVIVLKNGRKIQGHVLTKTSAGYVIEVPYGRMTIPEWQVTEIIEESESDHLRKTGERLLRHDDRQGLELLRRAFELNRESGACRTTLVRGLTRAARSALDGYQWKRAEALMVECAELAENDLSLAELRKRLKAVRSRRDALLVAAEEAYLSQDVATAHSTYGELLDLFPNERDQWRRRFSEMAILLGHSHFEDEEFTNALDYYREALAQEPDLISVVRLPFVYAQVKSVIPLMESRQFAEALAQLRQAQDLVPEEPAVLYHIGLCYEALGEPSDAARIYRLLAGPEGRAIDGVAHVANLRRVAEETLRGNPSRSASPAAGAPRSGAGTPQLRKSRTFAIQHRNPTLAREAERLLEHHWRRLKREWFRGRTLPRFGHLIPIYLHPDRATFLREASAPSWSNGITRSDHRFGAILSQEIHFNADSPQFLSSELPHEVAHLLVIHRIGDGRDIPKWIDEGFATSAEPSYKLKYYDRVVREAIEAGTQFPLAELVAQDTYPREVLVPLFYAQCSSLVRFLQERLGTARTFTLLHGTIESNFGAALVKDNRYSGIGDVERRWKKWALAR